MDDLLDLDFASSSKQPPAQQGLNPQARYGRGRTAFDYLAQATSAPVPTAPARTPTPNQQRAAAAAPEPQGAAGDAFSSLFGTSASQPPANNAAPLSMQERLQRDSAAKIGGFEGSHASGGSLGGSAPAGGVGGSRAPSAPLQPTQRVASPSSSSLLSPTSRTASPANAASLAPPAPAKTADVWDFDLLSTAVPAKSPSPTPSAAAPPPAAADDPFDLGFDAPVSSAKPPNAAPAPTDDFDLLDAFATPAASRPSASPAPAPAPAPAPSRGAPRPSPSPAPTSASPPPHILGQLVEMGFPPEGASAALVASRRAADGAWDLDAALEVLVNAQQRDGGGDADEWGEEDNVRIGRRRSWERDADEDEERERRVQAAAAARRRDEARRRNTPAGAAPDADVLAPRTANRVRRDGDAASASAPQDPVELAREQAKVLQEQAGEMLAHAQKLGFSMFKSANAYWGEGKKALAKKLEEQKRAGGAGAGAGAAGEGAGRGAQGAGGANGRPKWWTEEMEREEQEGRAAAAGGKGKGRGEAPSFRDDDDEVTPAQPFAAAPPAQRPPRVEQEATPPANEYRSPFRRGKAPAPAPAPCPPAVAEVDLLSGAPAAVPPRSTPSPSLAASRGSAPPSRASPSPTPTPTPRRAASTRAQVPVSPSALSTAQSHKSTGNEHFKLGRFGEATAAYTRALDALPDRWLGRVPLLNNRAQARLRSGEEKAAAEDCAEAVGILVGGGAGEGGGEPDLAALEADSAALPMEVGALYPGAPLDLKDQLGKALGRRAKAFEALEKWGAAREDWERVLRFGDEAVSRGAGGAKMVSDGVGRCRKMLDPAPPPAPRAAAPSSSSSTASSARPAASRPRPRPTAPVQGSGEAVRALQAQQAAAAAEDNERHELKDAVDARIAAWKGGKETNLRALIASLDTVLWPELGWKTVGMHELISEGQLKVRYVRAIAKLHPDKLNVSNTTVEQRMVAALVFAALNEAWNAKK